LTQNSYVVLEVMTKHCWESLLGHPAYAPTVN